MKVKAHCGNIYEESDLDSHAEADVHFQLKLFQRTTQKPFAIVSPTGYDEGVIGVSDRIVR